jgi:hypothetical protein
MQILTAAVRAKLIALAQFAPRLPGIAEVRVVSVSKNCPGVRLQLKDAASSDPDILAEEFHQIAYDAELVLPGFDWTAWMSTDRAQLLTSDHAVIASVDADELFKLVTAIVRSDRFCEGALEESVRCGLLLAIAKRAETLVQSD